MHFALLDIQPGQHRRARNHLTGEQRTLPPDANECDINRVSHNPLPGVHPHPRPLSPRRGENFSRDRLPSPRGEGSGVRVRDKVTVSVIKAYSKPFH